MPIKRKEIISDNGGIAIEEIYTAFKPQPFAIVENGVVIDNIIADANEYSLKQIQDLFGGGNLVSSLPESYGIGDFYDAEAGKWTKAPQSNFIPEETEMETGQR